MGKAQKRLKKDAPIRVLHLLDRLHGGGVENQLWDIVRLTSSEKVKHLVVTFSPDKGKWVYADLLRQKGAYHQSTKKRSLKIDPEPEGNLAKSQKPLMGDSSPEKLRLFLRGCVALWRVIRSSICFRPDIIHVHGKFIYPIGLLAKMVLRRPMVHSVPCTFSQMVGQGKAWLPKLYTRFHSLVDCFFSFLPEEEWLKLGIPVSKVFPMRGSLDLQEINAVRQDQTHYQKIIREELKLPFDALIALAVGRLLPLKGHQFSLEALPALLEKFPKLHLLIIGEGKQRIELEESAKAMRIDHHVHFLGFQKNLLPFYAAASVYLRTTVLEAENFCSHIAMGMGLPIVGFDSGVKNELIQKVGHGILVPNQNVGALVVAVAQILMLPDQGKEMGGRGIVFSRENLDIRQAVEDIATVYKNLKGGSEPLKDTPV